MNTHSSSWSLIAAKMPLRSGTTRLAPRISPAEKRKPRLVVCHAISLEVLAQLQIVVRDAASAFRRLGNGENHLVVVPADDERSQPHCHVPEIGNIQPDGRGFQRSFDCKSRLSRMTTHEIPGGTRKCRKFSHQKFQCPVPRRNRPSEFIRNSALAFGIRRLVVLPPARAVILLVAASAGRTEPRRRDRGWRPAELA